ncbi:MAG: DNA repair protein RecN [Bacilli bacterium]|nr:DNA repair protein RecN [Bacilli bacterium]
MLKRLTITNLAIIENIDVSFGEGFTVLTGETGAGKSLVIDSLSLLLGARASNELIRAGEDSATIRGVFAVNNRILNAVLMSLEIPENDGEIVVSRTLSKAGTKIKVNGVSITLQDLLKISKYLADIHSQFDFEKILNPENYLGIIDGFSSELISSYKKDYSLLLSEYRARKKEYEALLAKKQKIDEDRDFYEYQYKELKAMALQEGEQEEIESQVSLLSNYDKVYSLSQEAEQILHSDFLDQMYELNEILEKLAKYQPQYQDTQTSLVERYYEISDMFDSLKKDLREIDYDPSRLDELQQRDADLTSIQRKYKKNISELIAYRDELASTLGNKEDFEFNLKEKQKEMDEAFKKCKAKGEELTTVRKKTALSIEKELERNMDDLRLHATFKVDFLKNEAKDDSILKEDGMDTLDFLIETNVGEGMKSLGKVISGGEAARIMLAFKATLIKANRIPTVIFDEIDTGVSGESAQAVAKKIREISLSSQVISITHMPQVASLSDHHILISKEVKGDRTFAHIKELSLEEKINQVAYLISGGTVTEKQLEYAKEMVLSSR